MGSFAVKLGRWVLGARGREPQVRLGRWVLGAGGRGSAREAEGQGG